MRNFINKNKNLLKGLFAVLLTIAFAGAVIYLAVEDNNKVINEIHRGQIIDSLPKKQAEKNELIANGKRDSAIALLDVSRQNEILIISKVLNLEKSVNSMRTQYLQQLNELKNIQNEKDIVNGATGSQQLDFITKYKYTEYR